MTKFVTWNAYIFYIILGGTRLATKYIEININFKK